MNHMNEELQRLLNALETGTYEFPGQKPVQFARVPSQTIEDLVKDTDIPDGSFRSVHPREVIMIPFGFRDLFAANNDLFSSLVPGECPTPIKEGSFEVLRGEFWAPWGFVGRQPFENAP